MPPGQGQEPRRSAMGTAQLAKTPEGYYRSAAAYQAIANRWPHRLPTLDGDQDRRSADARQFAEAIHAER